MNQLFGAVANKALNLSNRSHRVPELTQRAVRGFGDIRRTVHQGAVEIEQREFGFQPNARSLSDLEAPAATAGKAVHIRANSRYINPLCASNSPESVLASPPSRDGVLSPTGS